MSPLLSRLHLFFSLECDIIHQDIVRTCNIYLHNDSDEQITYTYRFTSRKEIFFETTEHRIAPHSQHFLHTAAWDTFSEKPKFTITIRCAAQTYALVYQPKAKDITEHVHRAQLASAAPAFHIAMNTFMNSHVHKKTSTSAPLPTLSIPSNTRIKKTKSTTFVRTEIDLHIGKDVSEQDGKIYGFLEAQMRVFEYHFYRAREHNKDFLRVIYGKGDGILRGRVHTFLEDDGVRHEEIPNGGGTIIYF